MTEPRNSLRAAIDAADHADIDRAKAHEALERAKSMLEQTEAELATYADIDGEIANFLAGRLKAAIGAGELLPDLSALPTDLQGRRAKRAELAERVAAVSGVHAELTNDLKTSEQALERKRYEVELAVEAVVVEDAKAAAEVWLTDLAALAARYWQFEALSQRRIRNAPGEPTLPGVNPYRSLNYDAAVRKVAVQSRGVLTEDNAMLASRLREPAAAKVGAWIHALQKDPNAKLEDIV